MQKNTAHTLPELISPYLASLIEKTGGVDGPIGKQFVKDMGEHVWNTGGDLDTDPLEEDEYEVAPGLIYKYKGAINKDGTIAYYGRALFTITRFCTSYCRFCTRGREVGIPAGVSPKEGPTLLRKPFLSEKDIDEALRFIETHKEINEIILSGGDPLATPEKYLTYIIEKLHALQKKGNLSIIRIGTRVPIANPYHIQSWHYEVLKKIDNLYLMVHINHPEELTKETLEVLKNFRKKCFATIMSQTVLLKGVNDSPETLINLFNLMTKNAIRPYYVFQCDPVFWAKQFIVKPQKAIALWEEIRPKLGGIAATARLVIDVPHGSGKIPVPEGGAWNVDYTSFSDFKKERHPFIS